MRAHSWVPTIYILDIIYIYIWYIFNNEHIILKIWNCLWIVFVCCTQNVSNKSYTCVLSALIKPALFVFCKYLDSSILQMHFWTFRQLRFLQILRLFHYRYREKAFESLAFWWSWYCKPGQPGSRTHRIKPAKTVKCQLWNTNI